MNTALVIACVRYLKLEWSYEIVFSSKDHKRWDAYHREISKKGKPSHKIVLYIPNVQYAQESLRSIDSIIAHEFIHAWQAENKLETNDPHGKWFQYKAKALQGFLNYMGYSVNNLYVGGHDE